MKKLIKTDGIVTNLFGPNTKIQDPKLRNSKAGNFAFVMVKDHGKMITSKNTITVASYITNGNALKVWYQEGNPYKVYRNPFSALLFGGKK